MTDRGAIVWVQFGERRGSSPAGRRPGLVLQSDRLNRSNIDTVVVAALTTNLLLARFPGNVLLPALDTGLPHDSVVNLTQISGADRRDLSDKITVIPQDLMHQVDAGLRLVLGL